MFYKLLIYFIYELLPFGLAIWLIISRCAETEIKLRVPGERFISPCPLFVGGNKCCSIFVLHTYPILVMDHLLFTRKYSYGYVQFKGGLFHFSNVFVFDTLMKSRELKNSGIVCKFKRNSTMVKMS